MKRQFCHAKFQKSNQKPIFISQNSIIMETDKCLFALIYIFQKLSGLIYLRNSFRFCVVNRKDYQQLLVVFLIETIPTPSRAGEKAYDGLAKAVECIHDMFFVCFCARHR